MEAIDYIAILIIAFIAFELFNSAHYQAEVRGNLNSLKNEKILIKVDLCEDQWCAWDHENNFLAQGNTVEELVVNVCEKLKVPPDRIDLINNP